MTRGSAATLLAAALLAAPLAALAADGVEITKAWAPASAGGKDVPVFMTITNNGAEPDDLLRARCEPAHFLEKRTTDYGEGAPSGREVKAITVPPGQATTLAPGGFHIMLLKAKPLAQGDSFTCTLAFKRAGSKELKVAVAAEGAKEAP